MQKTINIILKAVLTAFLAVFATGCITDKFDTSNGLQSVMLQVNISAGEMTKAEPDAAESVINSVRIYAYRADGTQAGHFYRAEASAEPIIMDLTLPEHGIYDVDFYVFVNEASMGFMDNFAFAENMTKAQLSGARFQNVNPTYGFPMYCGQREQINVDYVSQTPNTASGHEGHFYLAQQVSFKLIRPMAKLSVYGAIVQGGASGSITIHDVEFAVNGTRSYNYLLPQDNDVLAAVPTRELGRDLITQEMTLTKTIDKNNETARNNPDNYDLISNGQYLGEVEVGDKDWSTMESDRQAVLHVQYSVGGGGELQHGYVYLPAIVRNTHYKVCILINSEGSIMINYFVAPWDDAEKTEMIFDYPTHTYLRSATNETDKPASGAEMSETQPFVGYFKMSYPDNEEWTPVLLNGVEECDMAVYKVGESEPVTVLPVRADPDNWYKIEVKPKSGSMLKAGDEVELGITYASDYLPDVYDYLMINGSQGNYYWPYDGSSEQDPDKVIITVK